MKLECTKPFNAKHAKAGAPYCCRNGDQATVLKWDCRSGLPLAGVCGAIDMAHNWTAEGLHGNRLDDMFDLVMTPLCMCEGKPVFYDDELMTESGTLFRLKSITPGYSMIGVTWPKKQREYPQTTMSDDQLYASSEYIKTTPPAEYMRRIANAAIKHAIDSGQVAAKVAISDDEISDIADSMPGGLDGFLKGWGWNQFARAILAMANHEV